MNSSFRTRLADNELLIGTMVTLSSSATAEVLADAGFDWLFLDGEHGPLETAQLSGLLQVVGDRVPCLVRVPSAGEVPIKKALDLGAAGVIVPQVNTAEQAADVVSWSRFPPDGTRGVGLARAHGYGFRFQEYVEGANDQVVVVVQAEHIEAVRNIESIVAVPGIDAVMIGPYDLAASMDRMGQVDDAEVIEAIDRVTSACRDAGLPLGIFGVTAEALRPWIEKGYTLPVAGVDTMLLGNAARVMLEQVRGETQPRTN